MFQVGHRVSWLWVALSTLLPLLVAMKADAAPAKFRPAASGIARDYIVVLDVPAAKVPVTAGALGRKYGATVKDVWRLALRGFRAEMSAEQAHAMSNDPSVRFVEQNVPMFPSGLRPTNTETGAPVRPKDGNDHASGDYPSDEVVGPHKLWHLWRLSHRHRSSTDYQYTYESDGTGVRIYVVDLLMQRYHQEFVRQGIGAESDAAAKADPGNYPRVGPGSDQTNTPNRPSTLDDIHAAAVASLAAGRNVGLASGAEIRPVRAAPLQTTVNFINAFEWILGDTADHNPAVVTMSQFRTIDACQGYESSGRCNPTADLGYDGAVLAFEEAVQAVLKNGIPVVASANNNARDACHDTPARLSRSGGIGGLGRGPGGVITVGGLAKDGDWRYVNDSNTNASNFGPCVDLWAPAEKIATAAVPCQDPYNAEHIPTCWAAYRTTAVSGTSYAAPMVAGLIARMLQEDQSLRDKLHNDADRDKVPGIIWERLHDAATPFDQLAPLTESGLCDDPALRRVIGKDTALCTLAGTNPTTSAALLASSDRIAYMGPFSLTDQPESLVLTGTAKPLQAIPVGGPAKKTEWFRGNEQTPFRTKTGSDQWLCFTTGTTGCDQLPCDSGDPDNPKCESPATNTTYWARVTREVTTEEFTTDSATATVVVDKPIITSHPENRWIYDGASTQLTVGVLAPEGATPTIQWFKVGSSEPFETGTATHVTDAPGTSTGYFAKVTLGGTTVQSNVAFVRVQQACGTPSVAEYDITPPLGDVKPNENIEVALRGESPELEYRWWVGTAGTRTTPLRTGRYEDTHVVTFPAGAFPQIWVEVYRGECLVSQSGTIDLTAIEECDLGLPAALLGHENQRFTVSVPDFTADGASRVLSVFMTGSMSPLSAYGFDWYRETKTGANTVFQSVGVPLPDALLSTLPPRRPSLAETLRIACSSGRERARGSPIR